MNSVYLHLPGPPKWKTAHRPNYNLPVGTDYFKMPRLGDEPSDEEIRPLNRRQAVAYPGGDNQSRTFVYTILLFLAMFWIVPNFFFRVSAFDSWHGSM